MPAFLWQEEFDPYFQVCALGPTGLARLPTYGSDRGLAGPRTGSGTPSAGAGGRRAERARGLHRPAYRPPVRSPVSILGGWLSQAIPQRDDGNHVLRSKHEEI